MNLKYLWLTLCFLVCNVLVTGQTDAPTTSPTDLPTPIPTTTHVPSISPTAKPSNKPSPKPTRAPTPHIYGDNRPLKYPLPDQQACVATLTCVLFVVMAFEILSPEVNFLIALVILMLTEILSLSDTLSGAVERTHLVDWAARKAFGTEGSILMGKSRLFASCFSLSCFFNNTPLVAILMPVTKDWCRMRGLAAAQMLMPMNFAVLAGSFGSMIGTSSNLTLQGLMQADRNYSFPFFAPMPIGITCFVVLALYMLLAGPYLLPNHKSGLVRELRDRAENLIAEVYVSEHSTAAGKTLEELMTSLGVAPVCAVKIRRRVGVKKEDLRQLRKSVSKRGLDKNYLKETAKFWFTEKKVPDKIDYTSAPTSDPHDHGAADAEKEMMSSKDVEPEEGSFLDIVTPSHHEIIAPHDIVFISSAQDVVRKLMKSVAGESRGLYLLKSNAMALPGYGSEILEVVISDSNPCLGMKVKDLPEEFSERYKLGLITVRCKNWNAEHGSSDAASAAGDLVGKDGTVAVTSNRNSDGDVELAQINTTVVDNAPHAPHDEESGMIKDNNREDKEDSKDERESTLSAAPSHVEKIKNLTVSDHILAYGDIVLCVGNKKHVKELQHNRDFFVVSTVGSLPEPLNWYKSIPAFVFLAMLCVVAAGMIDMCPAALTVAAFFFIGGWIVPKDIPEMVDLKLLMLMGCSLSFAKAMTKTSLAVRIAKLINASNPSNFSAIICVYAITLAVTELISNNAAASLMYPIAVALADELGVDFKPFAMTVMIACTAGFMCPMGYQTHIMVWAPGGYNFRDFVIFGFVPDLIYWFIGCAIIVQVYPF